MSAKLDKPHASITVPVFLTRWRRKKKAALLKTDLSNVRNHYLANKLDGMQNFIPPKVIAKNHNLDFSFVITTNHLHFCS